MHLTLRGTAADTDEDGGKPNSSSSYGDPPLHRRVAFFIWAVGVASFAPPRSSHVAQMPSVRHRPYWRSARGALVQRMSGYLKTADVQLAETRPRFDTPSAARVHARRRSGQSGPADRLWTQPSWHCSVQTLPYLNATPLRTKQKRGKLRFWKLSPDCEDRVEIEDVAAPIWIPSGTARRTLNRRPPLFRCRRPCRR